MRRGADEGAMGVRPGTEEAAMVAQRNGEGPVTGGQPGTEGAAASVPRDAQPRVGCSVDADGRITFGLEVPSATRPQLLLRLRPKKGQPEKTVHLLDLEPAGDDRRRAVLEPTPVLAEGRWDVYLIGEPGAERQRLRPGLRDLRALVDGNLRDRPSPVAVRIPYVTKDGHLALRSWLRPAHAEADGIVGSTRSATTTVRARLHGASLSEGAAVRLRLRGGGGVVRTLRAQAEADGRTFSFTVDYAELVTGGGSGNRVWDVFVQPDAEAPLVRVGRLLDDVADRKEIFVYPAATVGDAVVRPYYTVDNDLAVEVRTAG
ncbi:transferase [Streptomyces sp. R21]|uniref:Transferase n=1 Tax=Streptomyces sp. R21 TaxID=3238627 RepID=A0AB39PNX3_9ACTN